MEIPNKTYVEILPEADFIIITKNGQKMKGRFSMYALDQFCEQKNIENYLNLLQRITIGIKIGDYADLVLIALQDYYRKNTALLDIKRDDVMDLLDEMGGINSDDFKKLIGHAIGRVANLKSKDGMKSEPATDEKKNQGLTDGNSADDATVQE